MSHRHAQRRGAVIKPSEAHLRMLSRLIKRADVADRAADDKAKALSLTVEAERAGNKAVLPVGHQNDANSPLVQLIRVGKAWHGMTVGARREAGIGELAARSREAVDAALLDLTPPQIEEGDQ